MAEDEGLQPYVPPDRASALQRYEPRPFDEVEEETVSLEHYIQVVLRRKWLLLSVALTVLFLATLQVFTATPIYEATSTLQIDPEDQKVLPYEQVESGAVGGSRDLEQYLWTQAEKLQSQGLASRVVERLDLSQEPAFTEPARKGVLIDVMSGLREVASFLIAGAGDEDEGDSRKLVSDFLDQLTVRPLRNTRLIEVTFASPEAELAAEVANSLGEEFIEQHLEGKFEATSRATQFLEKQLEDLQIQVEQSEQDLLRYAQEQNIVNLTERETIAKKRLADLSDELTAAETEYLSEQARFTATRSATTEVFPEVLKSESMRDIEEKLSTLEAELSGLSSLYGPEWPRVKTLRSEIAGLRIQLSAQQRKALSSTSQEAALAGDRRARLQAAVAEQRTLVDRLNEASIQYNILKRESESNKDLYEGLLQRLKEAGVSAGLRSSNIRIADQATVPRFAASPKKARSLALALVLGLFLGTGLVFLVDALDNTLKGADDVTDTLGLPSLGVIPRLEAAGTARKWGAFGSNGDGPRAPFLAFGAEGVKGKGRVLEAYRSLRTSLLLSHSGKPPKTILVTSALPGEGKSTTAANTAIALAQTGAPTLLMDLDMRKPTLASAFEIPSDQGMSTFLSGNSDFSSRIQQTRFANTFVIPAGPPPPNPAELLSSERTDMVFTLMHEYFTYMVIDSPPVLEISDALLLSPAVDGVILVARAGKTPRKAIGKAAAQIMAVGGTLLGVLVNGADLDRLGYGYGYGYGYGSYGGTYGRYFDDSSQRPA